MRKRVAGCRLPVAGWMLALIVLSGCEYGLVGSGNSLPTTIHTIRVQAFVNTRTRVQLQQLVTQAVGNEFVSRGRMRLVTNPKDADAILRGSIDSFGINPIAFNIQGRATQYQISITANIELVDHKN